MLTQAEKDGFGIMGVLQVNLGLSAMFDMENGK